MIGPTFAFFPEPPSSSSYLIFQLSSVRPLVAGNMMHVCLPAPASLLILIRQLTFNAQQQKTKKLFFQKRERETQFLVILSFMDCDVAVAFTHDDLFTYLVFIGDDR